MDRSASVSYAAAPSSTTNEPQVSPHMTNPHLHSSPHESLSPSTPHIRDVLSLWARLFLRAQCVAIPVVTLLAGYFLPALILPSDQLTEIEYPLYDATREAIGWTSLYALTALTLLKVFGRRFCRRALLIIVPPSLGLTLYLRIPLGITRVGTLIYGVACLLMVILISAEKDPTFAPANSGPILLLESRQRRELFRPFTRMALVIWLAYIALLFLFPVFLEAQILMRLALRFVCLPVITSLCSALQIWILHSVRIEFLGNIAPIMWVSGGILKLYERIFTICMFGSNSSPLMLAYVSFVASIMEMCIHATYFRRMNILDRFMSSFLARIDSVQQRFFGGSISANLHRLSSEDNIQEMAQQEQERTREVRKHLCQFNIAMELKMLVTVTFLLFFMHTLVSEDQIVSIKNVSICFINLSIQFCFEFLSDSFCLHWTISQEGVLIDAKEVQSYDTWFSLWVLLLIWQSFTIFGFLMVY
eukprot:TRINITY_DN6725_c0_g1_i2.p1 TRINITY_DN6725_c0_g1~~TRINITY_DN6725_c0_g1_i2.p1  ORF type:complete len:475 (+),score=86.52 TRINITY_DN6725_c0_g1_i2:195-1619(+)